MIGNPTMDQSGHNRVRDPEGAWRSKLSCLLCQYREILQRIA
jgi:hypothetical protein